MDWLILILGVPAILIPLVLLFGFAGCGQPAGVCTDDTDCPPGLQCGEDGQCFAVGDERDDPPPPPPSAPTNLVAVAIDDRSVSLKWKHTDLEATDVQIERSQEDGAFVAIPAPADLTSTTATDASPGLLEGVTFIYQVRARLDGQLSKLASETASATLLPRAPVSLAATRVSFDQIDLRWNNASATATDFSLERSVSGGPFAEIIPGPGSNNTFSDTGIDIGGLSEGTTYDYRVFAIVAEGFQNDVRGPVKSAPSATLSATTLAFTAAFTAPPGTLTTDQPNNEGICLVQRLSTTLLAAGGTQVRIVLRGSPTGSLTLDKVAISQVSTAAGGDLYDAAPDRTDVASGVTIQPNTTRTVGPVNYTLDPTKDLLVAFDISNTLGEGGLIQGALTGADSFASPPPPPPTAEAGVADRTSGYTPTFGIPFLVEKIEVL
jgi:hypothetical protein